MSHAIHESEIRVVLRDFRHGRPVDRSPLVHLSCIAPKLHAIGQSNRGLEPGTALVTLLQHLAADALDEGLDVTPSERDPTRPSGTLEHYFARGRPSMEAWAVLYFRYLDPTRERVARLILASGTSAATFDRRRRQGYRILAEALQALEARALWSDDASHSHDADPRGDDGSSKDIGHVGGTPAAEEDPLTLEDHLACILDRWRSDWAAEDLRFIATAIVLGRGIRSKGRWAARPERFESLAELVAAPAFDAVMLVGPPGAGKTTHLRHLERCLAEARLRGAIGPHPIRLSLRGIRSSSLAPERWLATAWHACWPHLPRLRNILRHEEVTLILDDAGALLGRGSGQQHERLAAWKDFLCRSREEFPNVRLVFACRSTELNASLSTPGRPLPIARIDPLDDSAIRAVLVEHFGGEAEALWSDLRRWPDTRMWRSPSNVRRLIRQVAITGQAPINPAQFVAGAIRASLRREIERDHPLFRPGALLTELDVRRILQVDAWASARDLPDDGLLFDGLETLACWLLEHDGPRSGVPGRASRPEALARLRSSAIARTKASSVRGDWSSQVLDAGLQLGMMSEDLATGEILVSDSTIQGYLAARRAPEALAAARLRDPWRTRDQTSPLRRTLATLAPTDPLPARSTSRWEVAAELAGVMSRDPATTIGNWIETNLPLAGRVAALRADDLPLELIQDLASRLLERSRDLEADVRARIAAAEALGSLEDPRYERQTNDRKNPVLLPPMVIVPPGTYPIGTSCDPDAYPEEMPGHSVTLDAFGIGRFPVTNREFRCFVEDGGYTNPDWWRTRDAQAWLDGDADRHGDHEAILIQVAEFRERPGTLEAHLAQGEIDRQIYHYWKSLLAVPEDALEKLLEKHLPSEPWRTPRYWHSRGHDRPSLPVVGVCWYEARAYCAWLSAQTGRAFRLPTEAEWEAAARGASGRRYAYGNRYDPLRANTADLRIMRATPVGVFPDGDTTLGISDLTGNVFEWTSTIYGLDESGSQFPYPYQADDGREDPHMAAVWLRISRGGSWTYGARLNRCSTRVYGHPGSRTVTDGFRVALTPAPKRT